MGPTRRLVTIKRSGVDGPHFPLSLSSCLFGRAIECDIRIQLPVVSKQHCKIEINDQEAVLVNFSSANPTRVNGSAIEKPVRLKHGDVITVVDRSFRYENESHQNGSTSAESPGQRQEQETLRRASRSSFSSNPGGKVQDASVRAKLTGEDVSGRAAAHVKNATDARTVAEDPAVGKTPRGAGEKRENAAEPSAGDFKEDPGVNSGSLSREPKAFSSTPCLENGDREDSPFRKLYESMKVELDVTSATGHGPQSRRKSGSPRPRTAEGGSAGAGGQGQTPVSLKPRLKSGRSPQTKADPAERDRAGGRTPESGSGGEPPRTPGLLRTDTKTERAPAPGRSPQPGPWRRRSEDPSVLNGSTSPGLGQGQSEGFGSDSKTWSPRRLLPRNQTPVKVEEADGFGTTPEKFSKKRKRLSTNADHLTTATGLQTIAAPLVLHVERKIQSDYLNKPEKLGTAAGQTGPGSSGLCSADLCGFAESMKTMEELPLKRRRVSFGGRLKPELFDENLPPNTPVKRGETPKQRRSLVTHTPAVLKKIIKEQPQLSGKEDASETHREPSTPNASLRSPAPTAAHASPAAPGRCRRSAEGSAASSGSKSPHRTDLPRRGGRRSGNPPSKRVSLDRGQHGILQMIYSRRRSGASEANLIVAKSWADVVKLGAKQTQSRAVKRGPPRQPSRRHRRLNTPKKPTDLIRSQFSTGHANSPCTIVIGRAHLERLNGPARPCRILNHFVPNKPMDFSEDLSGLTEMFKTPAKEKTQRMSTSPSTFSDPEDLLGGKLLGPHPGEKPLLCTSEILGGVVSLGTEDSPKKPAERSSQSPDLRRPPIRTNESIVKTPRNIYKTTGAETKTPGAEAELPKAASSANRLRRSSELRGPATPGRECENAGSRPHTVQDELGRRLRKTAPAEQKQEGEGGRDGSAKTPAARRSAGAAEVKGEPAAALTPTETPPEMEPPAGQAHLPGRLQSSARAQEAAGAENKTTGMHCKSPKAATASTPSRRSTQPKTPSRRGGSEGPSVPGKPVRTPGATTHERRASRDGKSIRPFKETPEQKHTPAESVTGSKRRPRTPKEKAQPLEDLAGFRELFQTPRQAKESVTGDKAPKTPCQSPQPEPVHTSASRKRGLRTPAQKEDTDAELSAPRRPKQTPEEARLSDRGPVADDEDKAFKEKLQQKLDSTEDVTGIQRRSRTPKEMAPPLEDLAGFRELFQTPHHAKELKAVVKMPKIFCISPQPEATVTPTNRKRQLKTPVGKVVVEAGGSAPRKPAKALGEATHTHSEPGHGAESIRLFQETPKQQRDSAENASGTKRRPRTPKAKAQPLEDLAGFRELFQTPQHAKEPVTGDKAPKTPCQSPQPEPVHTSASRKRGLRTPAQKEDTDAELSAPKKPKQTPEEARLSNSGPADGGKDTKVFQETSRQKLDSAENVIGIQRRPRTPKEKAPPLEDLAGFRELFQTPGHAKEPVTGDKAPKTPCQSPQPEPVHTPASRKRGLSTPAQKEDTDAELSAPRKAWQTPGDTVSSHGDPEDGDRGIAVSQKTPKQKRDSAENVSGTRRRLRTPKEKAQLLEDLAGFRDLFQTPHHAKESVTDSEAPQMPCQSPQPEPVHTLSRKGQLKTPSQKMGTDAELSVPRKLQQTPGGTKLLEREPEGGVVSQEALEQKLDSTEHIREIQRRPRTPKEKNQPLEDLAGFRELFQTPGHAKEPVTGDKSPKTPCRSPQPEPVHTPASRKRGFSTTAQEEDTDAELSAPRKAWQTPGGTVSSHREPEDGDRGIAVSQETPKQKRDSAENVSGTKRRPRTPKEKAQLLEDLAGFRELFQTPRQAKEPVTGDKAPKTPCQSPQPEPVHTSASRKRGLRTPAQKEDTDAELSAPRKPKQTPEEARLSDRGPVADDEDKAFKEKLQQKLDSTEDVTGIQRRSRTPKEMAPPLEDLAGFRELFQTPHHSQNPVAGDETPEMPCQSSQAALVTSTSKTRPFKTPPQKADTREGPSVLRKPRPTPGGARLLDRQPEGDRGTAVSQEAPEQKLNPSEHVTGIQRRPRTPKEKTEPLEDLAGFKEPFQTPHNTKEPATDDKPTKMPWASPPAEPVSRRTTRQRRLRSPPGEVGAEGPSAPRKPPRAARETGTSESERAGVEDINVSKRTSRKKLKPAENVSGLKSRPRTSKEETQPVEDEPSPGEIFPKPDRAKEEASAVKIAAAPCPPPPAEPVSRPARQRRLRSPPGQVGAEGPSAPRKPPRAARETGTSGSEPGDDEKDVKVFRETSRPNPDLAEKVIGVKSRMRTSKEKTQPVEDETSLGKLYPKPDQAKEEVSGAEIAAAPCPPPPAEPVSRRTTRQRRLRSPPGQVGAEGPSAPRKPPRAARETGTSGSEPAGDEEDVTVSKKASGKKLNPAENESGIKSRLRTSKEKTQPVEDEPSPGELCPKPDQAKEETSAVKIVTAPCPPPPAEPVSRRTTRQRRLRSPPGQVGAEGPSAPRKPPRAARETGTSGSELGDDEKDVKVFRETLRPNLDSAEKVIGVKSRLRTSKEKTQPVEDEPSPGELCPKPDQAKGLGNDAADVKRAPRPTVGRRQPVETPHSVLGASKVRFTGDPAGSRDPGRSPSLSRVSAQRERGGDGRASGRERLRPGTAAQEPEDQKPPQKRQRMASRERGDPPDLLGVKKKSLRIAVRRTEPVGKLPKGDLQTAAAGQGDDAGAPDEGESLRSGHPNTTDSEEQRPECLLSAEKMKPTRSEKSGKPSRERKPRGLEDGAEKPTSGAKVQESQVRLRSGRQNKTLSPDAAEGKVREKRVEIRPKDQEEKEATEHSGLTTALRSRKTAVRLRGDPAQRDSELRVTPSAKRGADSLQKEDDNVCVKKIRTRSQKS